MWQILGWNYTSEQGRIGLLSGEYGKMYIKQIIPRIIVKLYNERKVLEAVCVWSKGVLSEYNLVNYGSGKAFP